MIRRLIADGPHAGTWVTLPLDLDHLRMPDPGQDEAVIAPLPYQRRSGVIRASLLYQRQMMAIRTQADEVRTVVAFCLPGWPPSRAAQDRMRCTLYAEAILSA